MVFLAMFLLLLYGIKFLLWFCGVFVVQVVHVHVHCMQSMVRTQVFHLHCAALFSNVLGDLP